MQRILDTLADDFGFLLPGARRRLTGERVLRLVLYAGLALFVVRLILLAIYPEGLEDRFFSPEGIPFYEAPPAPLGETPDGKRI